MDAPAWVVATRFVMLAVGKISQTQTRCNMVECVSIVCRAFCRSQFLVVVEIVVKQPGSKDHRCFLKVLLEVWRRSSGGLAWPVSPRRVSPVSERVCLLSRGVGRPTLVLLPTCGTACSIQTPLC